MFTGKHLHNFNTLMYTGDFKIILLVCFVFGCAGSLLLCGPFSSCGEWGLLPGYGAQTSHCSSFSCCRAQAPRCLGSVAAVYGFSYFEMCRIFLDEGSNQCPLPWQVDSLPLDHQDSPMLVFNREGILVKVSQTM